MNLAACFAPAPYDLTGSTALVTGASAGIGLATACQLAAQGVNLRLVARRETRLKDIQQALLARFPALDVQILALDLTQPANWESLSQAGFDCVDILVNNAGLALGRDAVAASNFLDWQRMLDLNVTAAFELVRRVLPGMLARGGGDLICLGSIAGQIAYEGGAVYCASKHALRAFCQALRYETCGQNVRVLLVSPGMVETEFSQVRLGSAEAAAAVYAGMQPLTAANIAQAIVQALQQPRHVNWDELVILASDQGGVSKVVRHSV